MREDELMLALQMLLDRMNSGNMPISQEMWEKMQKGGMAGGNVTNVNITSGRPGKQVNYLFLLHIIIYGTELPVALHL